MVAGSSSNGHLFVWSAIDGSFVKMVKFRQKQDGDSGGGRNNLPPSQPHGTGAGVAAVDWGRGGSTGQQVASLDRKGFLVLWA